MAHEVKKEGVDENFEKYEIGNKFSYFLKIKTKAQKKQAKKGEKVQNQPKN